MQGVALSAPDRLLWVSDGIAPLTQTGFGNVSAALLPAFTDRFAVAHLALGGTGMDRIRERQADLPGVWSIYPTTEQDISAHIPGGLADLALTAWRPDVVFIMADPGQVFIQRQHIQRVYGNDERPAVVAYMPIEGEPLMPAWRMLLNKDRFPAKDATGNLVDLSLDAVISVSQYGQGVAERETGRSIPYAWHGINPEAWQPLDPEERTAIRARLGWTDRFVCIEVATNVARKEHPRLFDAIKAARELVPNVLLYDHTRPFNNFYLGGHNLIQLVQEKRLEGVVQFNADLIQGTGHYQGIAVDGNGLTLRDYYGAADCFVHLSEVEGFGLPLAEAMAMGLPIITPAWAAGWETVGGKDGAALGCDIADWTVNSSGTRVAHADPKSVARQIAKLAQQPKLRAHLAARGKEIVTRYRWEDARRVCLAETERALERQRDRLAARKVAA